MHDGKRTHMTPWAFRLTSILISRFLLNLQAANQKSTGMISSTGSSVASGVFDRVVGSLGGHIEFGGNADEIGLEYDVRYSSGSIEDVFVVEERAGNEN